MSFISKFTPKTLFARFMLIIIAPVLIGQLLSIYFFYNRHWYKVSTGNSALIVKEVDNLYQLWQQGAIKQDKGHFVNLHYQLVDDEDSNYQKADISRLELKIFNQALSRSARYKYNIIQNTASGVALRIFLGKKQMEIKIPNKALVNPSTDIFVMWIIALSSLLLILSLIFSRNQIKSILDLTSAMDAYGKGQKKIYKPTGAKEIRLAGLTFLKMRDRIERQSQKRSQMLAMISHDLKTPLTRMRLQTELMADNSEKLSMAEDINLMQKIIGSYLAFIRGEGGEDFTEIKFSNWLEDILNKSWQDKIEIEFKRPKGDALVKLKPIAMRRAIENILENSQKYAQKILINLYESEEFLYIDIEDNGPGVKQSDREKIFKPFFRSEAARTLSTVASSGLGLAIAREVITGHFGNITLRDQGILGGLKLRIQLPLAKPLTTKT